jgi:hypothetical protein
MTKSKKALMASAALAGLLAGSAAVEAADLPAKTNPSGTSVTVLDLGQSANPNAAANKHACQGQNDCKGQGGCKTSDNGCKGKNSCKGKGGCATDGSKK